MNNNDNNFVFILFSMMANGIHLPIKPFTTEEESLLKIKFQNEIQNNKIIINNMPITENYYKKSAHRANKYSYLSDDELQNTYPDCTKTELDAIIKQLETERNYTIPKGDQKYGSRKIIYYETKYPYYYKPKFALYPTYDKNILLNCNLEDLRIVAKQFDINWLQQKLKITSSDRTKLINQLQELGKVY